MFKKILVPLDGSVLAARIIPQVADLAKSHNAEVVLLNVYPDWGEATSPEVKALIEGEVKQCEAFLAQAAQDLKAQGVKTAVACVQGTPAHEIINYANQDGLDLIAMATHGRGEVAWVLGSVAEKVVSHATVPVLLFRVLGIKPPKTKVDFLDLLDRGIP
ncbi:MAG: universal stress protein [Desulfobaccales bacterium]|jgi:nucleotide-binding universal stress UspA family protein